MIETKFSIRLLVTSENRVYCYTLTDDRPETGFFGLAVDNGGKWDHYIFLNTFETVQECYDFIHNQYSDYELFYWDREIDGALEQIFLDIHGLPCGSDQPFMACPPMDSEKYNGYGID